MTSINKTFTLLYYIINYTIKDNNNQYQYIIRVAFVNKEYHANLVNNKNLLFILDKFAFKVFNYFTYNYKISISLVASHLLQLFNYYTLSNTVKFINLRII